MCSGGKSCDPKEAVVAFTVGGFGFECAGEKLDGEWRDSRGADGLEK